MPGKLSLSHLSVARQLYFVTSGRSDREINGLCFSVYIYLDAFAAVRTQEPRFNTSASGWPCLFMNSIVSFFNPPHGNLVFEYCPPRSDTMPTEIKRSVCPYDCPDACQSADLCRGRFSKESCGRSGPSFTRGTLCPR